MKNLKELMELAYITGCVDGTRYATSEGVKERFEQWFKTFGPNLKTYEHDIYEYEIHGLKKEVKDLKEQLLFTNERDF